MDKISEHIEEAYCEELDEVMDIDDAGVCYFLQPESNRKRLTFRCPDEQCRATNNPLIVAVNYDKERFIKTPHFRTHRHHQHIESCMLHKITRIYHEMLRERHKYTGQFERNIFVKGLEKFDDIIDIFISREEFEERMKNKPLIGKRTVTVKKHTDDDIKKRIGTSYLKTRIFDDVVESFEKLEIKQRRLAFLKIGGRRMAYGTAFKPVRYIDDSQTWRHIYYGEAKVYNYSKSNEFKIFYRDRTRHYSDSIPNLGIMVCISHDAVSSPETKIFRENLEKAASSNEYCCFYTFAKIKLVSAAIGHDPEKEWIRMDADAYESAIRFNVERCKQ
jgi:hypothetical protein